MALMARRLEPEEAASFRELVVKYIARGYDDIDESFPDRILEAHFKGFDPFGYFTIRKTIWALDDGGGLQAFVVAAEKRGGSVKFGPTIVRPEFQGRGLAGRLWGLVEDVYRTENKRKVYGTWPAMRHDVLKFASQMEWRIEALLTEQYRAGQDEFVAGKFLHPGASPVRYNDPESMPEVQAVAVRMLSHSDHARFAEFILREMPKTHGDIDDGFVQSIVRATERFGHWYDEKGKSVFLLENEDEGIVGCVVATPKRGGSVKMAPLLVRCKSTVMDPAERLLHEVVLFFREMKKRKVYVLVPVPELAVINSCRRAGFSAEGILREPYLSGLDVVVMGLHLNVWRYAGG